MEEYRTIAGYEGLYEVSNYGNVRSVERRFIGGYGAVCHTGGSQLKLQNNKNRNGRVQIMLCKEGKRKTHFVSILVAKAFPEICGEWFEGCEVDHIDTDVTNNVAANLRCVTKSQNMLNPITRIHRKGIWTEEMRKEYSERLKKNNPVSAVTKECRERMANTRKGKPNYKCWKRVCCYDAQGVFIKEYNSIEAASKETGIKRAAISNTINGRQKTGGGYEWKLS